MSASIAQLPTPVALRHFRHVLHLTLLSSLKSPWASEDEDQVAAFVEQQLPELAKLLDTYPRALAASLTKAPSSLTDVNGAAISLSATEQEFLQKLATALNCPYAESYRLFSRVFEKTLKSGSEESKQSLYSSDAVIADMQAWCHRERVASVRIIQYLHSSLYNLEIPTKRREFCRKMLTQLLTQDPHFYKRVLQQLRELEGFKYDVFDSRTDQIRKYHLKEKESLAELLFWVCRNCEFDQLLAPTLIADICDLFFCSKNHSSHFTQASLFNAALSILEVLQLGKILRSDPTTATDVNDLVHDSLTDNSILLIDKSIQSLPSSPITQLIILGWTGVLSCIHVNAQSLSSSGSIENTIELIENYCGPLGKPILLYIRYAQLAFESCACQQWLMLLNLVEGCPAKAQVVLEVFLLFASCFELRKITDGPAFAECIGNLLLEHPSLAESAWNLPQPYALESVLDYSTKYFPLTENAFFKLSGACLRGAPESRQHVFKTCFAMPSFAQQASSIDSQNASHIGDGKIRVTRPFYLFRSSCAELLLGGDAVGYYKSPQSGIPIVLWVVEFSILDYIKSVLDNFVSRANVLDETLFHSLKSCFCFLQSFCQSADALDLLMDSSNRDFVINEIKTLLLLSTRLFEFSRKLKARDLELVHSNMKFISSFTRKFPESTWEILKASGLIPSGRQTYSNLFTIRQEVEMRAGRYPVTMEFLKLVPFIIQITTKDIYTSQMMGRPGDLSDIFSVYDFLSNLTAALPQLRFTDGNQKTEFYLQLIRIFVAIFKDIPACFAVESSKPAVRSGTLGHYGSNLRVFAADFLYSNNGVRFRWLLNCIQPASSLYEAENLLGHQVTQEIFSLFSFLFEYRHQAPLIDSSFEAAFLEHSSRKSSYLAVIAEQMKCPISSVSIGATKFLEKFVMLCIAKNSAVSSFSTAINADDVIETISESIQLNYPKNVQITMIRFLCAAINQFPVFFRLIGRSNLIECLAQRICDGSLRLQNIICLFLLLMMRQKLVAPQVAAKIISDENFVAFSQKHLLREDVHNKFSNTLSARLVTIFTIDIVSSGDFKNSIFFKKIMQNGGKAFVDYEKLAHHLSLFNAKTEHINQLNEFLAELNQDQQMDLEIFRSRSLLDSFDVCERYDSDYVFTTDMLQRINQAVADELSTLNDVWADLDSQANLLSSWCHLVSVLHRKNATFTSNPASLIEFLIAATFQHYHGPVIGFKISLEFSSLCCALLATSTHPSDETMAKQQLVLIHRHMNRMEMMTWLCSLDHPEKVKIHQNLLEMCSHFLKRCNSKLVIPEVWGILDIISGLIRDHGSNQNFAATYGSHLANILSHVVHPDTVSTNQEKLATLFDRNGIYTWLLSVISHFQTKETPSLLKTVTAVLSKMALIPQIVIKLVEADIFRFIVQSHVFQTVVTANHALYNPATRERSQVHLVFCSILTIIANLISTMNNERVITDGFKFLDALASRMDSLFNAHANNDFMLTLAFAEECRLVTSLIYCFAHHSSVLKRRKGQAVIDLARKSLIFLRWVVDILVHRNRIMESMEPVTKNEQELAKKTGSSGENSFIVSMRQSLHYTIRNILMSIFYLSESHRIFHSAESGLAIDTILFLPYLEMPMNKDLISLGTLNSLLVYCKEEYKKQGDDRELFSEMIECCLTLFASQIVLNMENPHLESRQREQIAVDSSVELLAACDSFKDLMQNEKSKKMIGRLARFIETITSS